MLGGGAPITLQMFMRSSLLPLGVMSVVSLVGCGVPTGGDQPDAEAASSTATAIVAVERTVGPGDAVRGDAIVARFVRVRQGAVDDSALQLAGAALDVPALGTCTSARDRALPTSRSVELVDVGAVSLEGALGRTQLSPRAMPDPSGAVSGLFYYSARATDAFSAGGALQLRATGGDVEPFQVLVPSPRDPSDVHVGATPAGLAVAWDATDADARDLVYIDISSSSALVARCATSDVGRFVVPPGPVAGVDEGQLAVHRVHREPFRARGIDPGEIRFDLARVVTFRR